MTHSDDVLRVPTLMAAFDADQANGRLTVSGPVGVKFPPRLPAQLSVLIATVVEHPQPAVAISKVRISIAAPGGAVLPESVTEHTVRWRPGFQPGAPVFNYLVDTITATFAVQGAYDVQVHIGDDPAPRAVTSFGVFLHD